MKNLFLSQVQNPTSIQSCEQVLPPPSRKNYQLGRNPQGTPIPRRCSLILFALFAISFLLPFDMKSQIDATFSFIAPSCPSASDGQLCCETITGGVPPYSCSVDEQVGTYNPVTDCFENMPSGIYNITITDSQNNQGSAIGFVGPSSIPPVTVIETVVAAGCGSSDGSICCLINGGSGSFSYLWYQDAGAVLLGSGTTTSGQTICISGLAAGDYTLIIDDLNTVCGDIFSLIVPSATLSASATASPSTCTNPCNGSILVDLSSAIAPVTISWTGTSTGSVTGISGSEYLITGLCQGSYDITVDDASTCAPVVLSGQNIGLNTADIIISGCNNPIWNPDHFNGQTDITLSGNLIIMPGACLVIEDMTIRLQPGKFIRIHGTGLLTTTNTTYDAGCGDWWQGFEVGSLLPNTNTANRGFLDMSENCVITHANYAISNFHNNGSPVANTSGGRIQVTDTRFIDNNHDIALFQYYPQGPLNMANRGAHFENCSFELNSYTPGTNSDAIVGHAMVQLTNITDVRFYNCRAENFNVNYLKLSNGQIYKRFCQSSFSSFLWDGCDVLGGNCENSFVRGYIDAFRCDGDLTISSPNVTNVFLGPEITHTDLACYRGITARNVSDVRITDNTFNLFSFPTGQIPPNYYWAANIQYPSINASSNNPSPNTGTHFLFAGNEINFELPNGGNGNLNPFLSAGILVYNGGENDSYIIENTFNGCYMAAQFDDRNKGSDFNGFNDVLGLHYECNTLNKCRLDFVIRDPSGQEGDDAGVFGFQRQTYTTGANSNITSAGNKFNDSFSVNNNDDIANSIPQTSAVHRYLFHPNELNANGITEMSPSIQFLQEGIFNTCGYDYSSWQGENLMGSFQESYQNYEETKAIYLALLDGGNTDLVKGQVENASINNALSLYHDLMSLSPNISEEVLLKLIQKEDEFPSTLLALVLAANPSVPKSAILMNALCNRAEQLTSFQMNSIMQGIQGTSPKEILEMELLTYRMEAEKFRRALLKERASSFNAGSHLANILETYHEYEFLSDRLKEADLLIRNGFYQNGFDLLNDCITDFKLSESEEDGMIEYIEFLQIEFDIITRSDHTLSTTEISYLEQIHNNDPCGFGQRAYHLMVVFGGYPNIELDCQYYLEGETRSQSIQQRTEADFKTIFESYPNPVQGEILVVRMNQTQAFDCELKVYGIDGKLNGSFRIVSGSLEYIIPASYLNTGLNRVCLYSSDGTLIYSNNVIKL
jgi:hypothetical protein